MKPFINYACLLAIYFVALSQTAQAQSYKEQAKLSLQDANGGENFGKFIAVRGDILAVSAPRDFQESNGGSVSIYYRNDDEQEESWNLIKRIHAPKPQDRFAGSLALGDDVLLVGANQDSEAGTRAGAVFVFEKDAGGTDNWGFVDKIIASNTVAGDRFGVAVALSGDRAIIGAYQGENDTAFGTAYLFERMVDGAGSWREVKQFHPDNTDESVRFGNSVAIQDDLLFIGDDFGRSDSIRAGIVYVFAQDQGGENQWGQVKRITTGDPDELDLFGAALAVDQDILLAGANLDNEKGISAGAAYLFYRNEGGQDNWGQVKKIIPEDIQDIDLFGAAVSLAGDRAFVGTPLQDEFGENSGAVYIFDRNQGGPDAWGQIQKLTTSDAQVESWFGATLQYAGAKLIIGATHEDEQDMDGGAIYLFSEDQSTALVEKNQPLEDIVFKPNPFSERLEITCKGNAASELKVRIQDILGRIRVLKTHYMADDPFYLVLDSGDWEPGMYILAIYIGEKSFISKILKL